MSWQKYRYERCNTDDEGSLSYDNSCSYSSISDRNFNNSVYTEEDEEFEDANWSAKKPFLKRKYKSSKPSRNDKTTKSKKKGNLSPSRRGSKTEKPSSKEKTKKLSSKDKSKPPDKTKSKSAKSKSGKSTSKSKAEAQKSKEKTAAGKSPNDKKDESKWAKCKIEVKKLYAFMKKVSKSDPSDYRLAKALFGFPVGLLVAGGLFLVVIQPMDLDPDVRNLVGSITGLLVAIGFAFSVQVRCVTLLVLPTFFGRAGRAFISAFAIIFLMTGPINNIVTNCREVTRSLSCLAQLLANHTIEKWKLRLNPLKEAIQDLQEEGFLIGRITQTVKAAFQPITKELEDKSETEDLEADMKEVEQIIKESKEEDEGPPPNAFSVEEVKNKHSISDKMSQAQATQEEWEKKLDLRCEDVYGKAVIRCREWFGDLWDRCLDALWVLGYLLCWPLKMTFFCELVKLIPGALGMGCDSMEVVNPGIGETYQAAKEMIAEIANGLKVQLQYRLSSAGDMGPHVMTAEEIRAATMNEFETKARWLRFFMVIIKRMVALTFLLVFKAAMDYHKGFLTKFQYDNIYITAYFRRIDARRNTHGKQKLLPLKKTEKNITIIPTSGKLMPREKKQVVSGTIGVVLRVIITAIVVYVDYLLVWILNVIYKNSKIDYHQTGQHYVNVTVIGNGFMAEIVRMFLTTFNSNHTLDSITTNEICLPRAQEPDPYITAAVFLTYVGVIGFMFFEAFGLRLRRLICSFFYRKREKKRVLYLYNEMLKKRKGYLKHMRHKVRKQIRKNKLKEQTGVMQALRLQFPRLCRCLSCFAVAREKCLICQEPEGKTYVRCPTPGCNYGYCAECWKDIKRHCYACGGKEDGDSASDPSDEDDRSSDDSDVQDDDERFLD